MSLGGKRPGAGRPKGRLSDTTLALQDAARKHADAAIRALLHVAKKGKSEAARVMAATAILDRGFGRPRQAIEHSGEQGGPIELKVTRTIVRAAVAPSA